MRFMKPMYFINLIMLYNVMGFMKPKYFINLIVLHNVMEFMKYSGGTNTQICVIIKYNLVSAQFHTILFFLTNLDFYRDSGLIQLVSDRVCD